MLRIVIDTDPTSFDLGVDSKIDKINLANYIKALAGGVKSSAVSAMQGGVAAYGLVTFAGAPTADDTVDIAGVTFTAKASGATGNEFDIGGSVTITAANLVTAVNESADLAGVVTATSEAGVVTLTSAVPGAIGNGLGLVDTLDNATITAFANGSNGTLVSL